MSEPALAAILELFPAHTHPLTLVSDPDALLADEKMRGALRERGFRLLQDVDPLRLRLAVRQAQPFTAEQPTIVVTTGPLESLPYDLWQPGRHVTLSLDIRWPGLDVGVLRTLTPRQRGLLGAGAKRSSTVQLSTDATQAYVLQQVFGFSSGQRSTRAALIRWLAEYHAGAEQLPSGLAEHVLAQLRTRTAFAQWPLEDLIAHAASFYAWVQRGWEAYLAQSPATQQLGGRKPVQNPSTAGELHFANDPALQDALGTLVRYKALQPVPVQVREANRYAFWAQPGIIVADAQIQETQLASTLTAVEAMLEEGIKDWEGWQQLALRWAEIAVLHYKLERAFSPAMSERYERAAQALDDAFVAWLATHYTQLAGRMLPTPHHLFHVPQKLARDLRQSPQARTALLILDGLALEDWLFIRSMWKPRHPDWNIEETCVLAQVPSITAVSRQALIGGMRPNELTRELIERPREEQAWQAFWQRQALPPERIAYARLPEIVGADYPMEITSHRTKALCLISTVIDEIVHGATQGAAGVHAALAVWLSSLAGEQQHEGSVQQGSAWMEGLIDLLLTEGYTVTLTGDHGHVEAVGVGNPREGVLAHTRSKRTRLYSSLELAQSAAARLSDTMVIENNWLCPQGMFPILPLGRIAYAPPGERIVSHGGLTVEEMIVPLVTLQRQDRG